MGLYLRRWGLELACASLGAYFLFNGLLYNVCVRDRPRTPMPANGWIFPVWTKFGICYTSAFESLMQRYFFIGWASIFVIAFLLGETYRENWIRGRSLSDNLAAQQVARDRDLNGWRAAVFFVVEVFVLCVIWRWL
jgi:hypothetical protein